MELYEFLSHGCALRGLTTDRTGVNLPAAYAPWVVQNDSAPVATLRAEDALYDMLQKRGFFLTSATRPPVRLVGSVTAPQV
jgi:hypothetical protein